MRGVSALDQALAETTDMPVHLEVVWVPVIPSDWLPWRPKRRSVRDPRALQSWDPDRVVSDHLLAMARAHPEWLTDDERDLVADPDAILWDTVMIWPPGARWDALPEPAFHAAPVVSASESLAAEIRAAGR